MASETNVSSFSDTNGRERKSKSLLAAATVDPSPSPIPADRSLTCLRSISNHSVFNVGGNSRLFSPHLMISFLVLHPLLLSVFHNGSFVIYIERERDVKAFSPSTSFQPRQNIRGDRGAMTDTVNTTLNMPTSDQLTDTTYDDNKDIIWPTVMGIFVALALGWMICRYKCSSKERSPHIVRCCPKSLCKNLRACCSCFCK